MSDTVQQIKDRVSVVEVVSQYAKLTKAGANYKARCPFHSEKTPSFTVSPSRGTYHCFGCGAGGDIFTFVQEIEGLDFKGALKLLAERAGVEIKAERKEDRDEREQLFAIHEAATSFFMRELTDTHPARTYLHERGLADETITTFRVGWAPADWHALEGYLKSEGFSEKLIEAAGLAKRSEKGLYDRFRSRIMFPIADSAGRVVAFSGRIFGEDAKKDDVAKYMNSPETPLYHKSRILYGFDRAKQFIRKYDFTILVEGQMDLVMSHQAGWGNTVAVSGTALTPEHLSLIRRMSENLVLALDADAAGLRAAVSSATAALSAGMDVKVAKLPEGLDPADLIAKDGKDAWKDAIRSSVHIVSFMLGVLRAGSSDTRALRKQVEREVLPVVAAIKSPIDREHFMHEVAEEIGVSDSAVESALTSMPQRDETEAEAAVVRAAPRQYTAGQSPRLRQLFGLLLWQESLEKPQLDTKELARLCEEAAPERFGLLRTLTETQAEKLRFEAESFYGDSEFLQAEADALVASLARERVEEELRQATAALREAEAAGDETKTTQAVIHCNELRAALAQLK